MGLYAVAASQLVFWLFQPVYQTNLDGFLQKRNFTKRERGATRILYWRVLKLRFWGRPDRANAAIAGTSDLSRNVVDSVISATQWRRLRCSGTYHVLGPAYNQTPDAHSISHRNQRLFPRAVLNVQLNRFAYVGGTRSCQLATDLGCQQLVQNFGWRQFQENVFTLDFHWESTDVVVFILERFAGLQ